MKVIITIILLMVWQLNFGQITQDDIDELRKIPKTYQLDILDQKKENNKFITKKHSRYVVSILNNKIVNQNLNDTIYMESIEDRIIDYQYNNKGNLNEISYYDFQKNLKKEVLLGYLKGDLSNKTTIDKYQKEIVKIKYNYTKCKSNYITDYINDSDIDDIDNVFNCETITTLKVISNYEKTVVKVFKRGIGLIKKIELKAGENSPIKTIYQYNYDGNSNIISIFRVKEDKIKHYKSFEYNENNDLTKIIFGNSELYYTYKYDEFNNWIEKIETSKVKGKRRVFKQTFDY